MGTNSVIEKGALQGSVGDYLSNEGVMKMYLFNRCIWKLQKGE
jgi:hypothetical protein